MKPKLCNIIIIRFLKGKSVNENSDHTHFIDNVGWY